MSHKLRIIVIEGPNLNALGQREPQVYGHLTLAQLHAGLTDDFVEDVDFRFIQSNVEGELINALYDADQTADGIIINPGGYSHTSVALADAIASVKLEVVEVHLSNLHARESYRHNSLTGARCAGVISGFGADSYVLAVRWYLSKKA